MALTKYQQFIPYGKAARDPFCWTTIFIVSMRSNTSGPIQANESWDVTKIGLFKSRISGIRWTKVQGGRLRGDSAGGAGWSALQQRNVYRKGRKRGNRRHRRKTSSSIEIYSSEGTPEGNGSIWTKSSSASLQVLWEEERNRENTQEKQHASTHQILCHRIITLITLVFDDIP